MIQKLGRTLCFNWVSAPFLIQGDSIRIQVSQDFLGVLTGVLFCISLICKSHTPKSFGSFGLDG